MLQRYWRARAAAFVRIQYMSCLKFGSQHIPPPSLSRDRWQQAFSPYDSRGLGCLQRKSHTRQSELLCFTAIYLHVIFHQQCVLYRLHCRPCLVHKRCNACAYLCRFDAPTPWLSVRCIDRDLRTRSSAKLTSWDRFRFE